LPKKISKMMIERNNKENWVNKSNQKDLPNKTRKTSLPKNSSSLLRQMHSTSFRSANDYATDYGRGQDDDGLGSAIAGVY